MVETAQGHDKETTPGPVKAMKKMKKLKASKHNLGSTNSGAIDGMLLLIFLFNVLVLHPFDGKSSMLSFLKICSFNGYLLALLVVVADGLTFFYSGDADPSLASHSRYDTSLSKFLHSPFSPKPNLRCYLCLFIYHSLLPGLLTKKFINLLQAAEDGTLDLNKAAETLEVCSVIN